MCDVNEFGSVLFHQHPAESVSDGVRLVVYLVGSS